MARVGAAVLVGAVNTLARVEDGFMGYNTDVEGVVRNDVFERKAKLYSFGWNNRWEGDSSGIAFHGGHLRHLAVAGRLRCFARATVAASIGP